MLRFLAPASVLALLASAVIAQTIQVAPVTQAIVEKRLAAYAIKNDQRELALRPIFEDAGCLGAKLVEQSVKGLKAPNLICNLPGAAESAIIVGAHFDLVEKGHGVADNWSGASLLASLYEGIATLPRRHTFQFVAFSGEEKGLVGSKAYVQQLGRNRQLVAAMVNLDTLGLGETEVWVNRSDPRMVDLMAVAASSVKLSVSGMNIDEVGTTDSESFRMAGIPAITIHSVTSETLPILHTRKDRIEVIHKDEYYGTYRLVLAYLAVLDQNLD